MKALKRDVAGRSRTFLLTQLFNARCLVVKKTELERRKSEMESQSCKRPKTDSLLVLRNRRLGTLLGKRRGLEPWVKRAAGQEPVAFGFKQTQGTKLDSQRNMQTRAMGSLMSLGSRPRLLLHPSRGSSWRILNSNGLEPKPRQRTQKTSTFLGDSLRSLPFRLLLGRILDEIDYKSHLDVYSSIFHLQLFLDERVILTVENGGKRRLHSGPQGKGWELISYKCCIYPDLKLFGRSSSPEITAVTFQ